MEMDERFRWLETRILSSLRPRQEDLKNMFVNEENRLAFNEFMNNENVMRLFVHIKPPNTIVASIEPPTEFRGKSIIFMQLNRGVKLTKDNIGGEVTYMDCSDKVMEHMDLVLRQVFMPMLCTDRRMSRALPAAMPQDKVVDLLHRITAALETGSGHMKGNVILALPSSEVLTEATNSVNPRVSVLHILESTIIGWIKQVKSVLKHDHIADLNACFGNYPCLLDEETMWKRRITKLVDINQQLDQTIALDIVGNLKQANSTYAATFVTVRKDINKALADTEENVRFLKTLLPWFEQLRNARLPDDCSKIFPALVHTIRLVWTYSSYYHQKAVFNNLLRLIANDVVVLAEGAVGQDVLIEPLKAYDKLRGALGVCALFRGNYLDECDVVNVINARNAAASADKGAKRPHDPLWNAKMYGPFAYILPGSLPKTRNVSADAWAGTVLTDSPWPPRNATCFAHLNSFMDRCNDVLELVETTRHFEILSLTAEVGGAGAVSLDALVREIHEQYTEATAVFFSRVTNVLDLDASQGFERAFFTFRTVVRELERRLADVLRIGLEHSPTFREQLRLLQVFEGFCNRELVVTYLKENYELLVKLFTDEVLLVKSMFETNRDSPPSHINMPRLVSKLYWIYGLRQRLVIPMEKLNRVCRKSLTSELGRQLKAVYRETLQKIEECTKTSLQDWEKSIDAELVLRLKQPLLIVHDYEYGGDDSYAPSAVRVNLDQKLMLTLREIRYLGGPPFLVKLPRQARELIRNTNADNLQVMAVRLELVATKYNHVMKTVTDVERPLFERKLAKINQLFEEGLTSYTWQTSESQDFIEIATSLVFMDVHHNLDIIQCNNEELINYAKQWCKPPLDIFTARDPSRSYSMEELEEMSSNLEEQLRGSIVPHGRKIHNLMKSSFEAAHISEASPAWLEYLQYVDGIVLDGLKTCTLTSLQSMLNNLLQSNMAEGKPVPILTVRLELLGSEVGFRPPLDELMNVTSVQESARQWMSTFVSRGGYTEMFYDKESYKTYLDSDMEIQQITEQINRLMQQNAEECLRFLEIFTEYHFLWDLDVNQTFDDFLRGKFSPNPLRPNSTSVASKFRRQASARTSASRASSAKSSIETAGIAGTAERAFLTPKNRSVDTKTVPLLDEFDCEIDIYKIAKEEIAELQDYEDVGWLRVDLLPIKHVLTLFAEKWMWTYTQFLSDQVRNLLHTNDDFLIRFEPEIDSISGDERDTASFMRMMRLFNEISIHSDIDSKFVPMHRTILLLKKYKHHLQDETEALFLASSGRWNSLKTKVMLAKQRIGPRIHEQSAIISADLKKYEKRIQALLTDKSHANLFSRDCGAQRALTAITNFCARLSVLEEEAYDLSELQSLLEESIVNFSVLPKCRHELECLRLVWETADDIYKQQAEWQRHRWQKFSTKFLRGELAKQLNKATSLPQGVMKWDVYQGLYDSITTMQLYLPLIDDLSNPAMRTRHWKQVVRVAGDQMQISTDALKQMTLKELVALGLHTHVNDVRAIIQRAIKDLTIENSLKFYEEVWLSKIFEMKAHVRSKAQNYVDSNPLGRQRLSMTSLKSSGKEPHPAGGSRDRKSGSRDNSRASVNRQPSIGSLPGSIVNLGLMPQETGDSLQLLANTETIFIELESHQISLQAMQSSNVAGSFVDEVVKWQKRLLTIETVLKVWLAVQAKWAELEDLFTNSDMVTTMVRDVHRFAVVDRDFQLLMRATEKNPNVLMCCSRKNIQSLLEHMKASLDQCSKSLVSHVETRREAFPRLYFLSMNDVHHIVCNGYNLCQLNRYISKVFDNVASLIYDELYKHDTCNYQITGVQSFLGERLIFTDPVLCEGHVESWLPSVLIAIKASLQTQIVTALDLERLPSRASAVLGQARSLPSAEAGERESVPSTSASAVKLPDGVESSSRLTSGTQMTSTGAAELTAEEIIDQQSWMLDHVTEVVALVTQMLFSYRVQEAVVDVGHGKKNALKNVVTKFDAMLEAAVMMLRGLETESEKKSTKESESSEITSERDVHSGRISEQSQVSSHGQAGKTSRAQSYKSSTNHHDRELISSTTPHSAQMSEVPGTEEPMDTVNLSSPFAADVTTVDVNGTEDVDAEQRHDVRLMLLPSQIHKITTVISVIAHKRALLRSVMALVEEGRDLDENFDWTSQIRYVFQEDNHDVSVQCVDMEFMYGFEYLGSSNLDTLSYSAEQMHVYLLQAVKNYKAAMCVGPTAGGRLEVVQGLARALGQPLYTFNCSPAMDPYTIQDIFKGYANTGAWLCFANLANLEPPSLNLFGQMLSAVTSSLVAARATVDLLTEEVELTSAGACFAVQDSNIKLLPSNPNRTLLLDAAVAKLPVGVLSQFRAVAVATPDIRLLLEIQLLSQGFVNARSIAERIDVLYTTTSQLINVDMIINENTKFGGSNKERVLGWSLRTMRAVCSDAGPILHQLHQQRLVAFEQKRLRTKIGMQDLDEENEELEAEVTSPTTPEAVKNAATGREESDEPTYAANILSDENEAIVTSLRTLFLPRLQSRDASIFAAVISDLWPAVDVPLTFNVNHVNDVVKLTRMTDKMTSYRGSVVPNTSIVSLAVGPGMEVVHDEERKTICNMEDAIAVATRNLGLMLGTAFHARVAQLAHLNAAHRTIIVVGPPGCGKSEAIKTFAAAERCLGKTVTIQSVFTKAVKSQSLFGQMDPITKEWKNGLIPTLLGTLCTEQATQKYDPKAKLGMKILLMDGMTDASQMDILESVLLTPGNIVLPSNERMIFNATLRCIWELDTISELSPAFLANVGLLSMSDDDVGWRLTLARWLERWPENDRRVIQNLCDRYVDTVMDYLLQCTRPAFLGGAPPHLPQYSRIIAQSQANMIATFCSMYEAMLAAHSHLSDEEREKCFTLACVWSMGGTLHHDNWDSFSTWFTKQFPGVFPERHTVFDYVMDADTRDFIKWSDSLVLFSGQYRADAVVSTTTTARLTYLMGLFADIDRPLMIIGERGCGKSTIVHERVKSLCSSEVAEHLGLTINTNRFTTAAVIHQRLDEKLEWRYGKLFVPKGNKRLLCFVDDLNLAQVDEHGNQTAVELVRQHIDDDGFFSPDTHVWRYVNKVNYVTTINPTPSASVPKLSARLLRHFVLLQCCYPDQTELHTIYRSLMTAHFFPMESFLNPTSTDSPVDDRAKRAAELAHKVLTDAINTVITCTIELQARLRHMYLHTAQRGHYVFNMRNLRIIFSDLCTSLDASCSSSDLLTQWRNECDWAYKHRMGNSVDKERYDLVFNHAVKKQFTTNEHIEILTCPHPPMFSSICRLDSGVIRVARCGQIQPLSGKAHKPTSDTYRPVNDLPALASLLREAMEEYNKLNPQIRLHMYKSTVEHVCHLARTISSNRANGHCVIVSDGSPGLSTLLIRLAAHLSGYKLVQIHSSPMAATLVYRLDNFKADLSSAYIRAGLKREKVLFLLLEEDLYEEDFLVLVEAFIVSPSSITQLFSFDEQTTIINSIRTNVTQAGLTYTRDVAWEFFLRTVSSNFRVCIVESLGGSIFQRHCREFPVLTQNVNFVWMPHWEKRELIDNAHHLLKEVSWMNEVERENIAHMLASMHLFLRLQDGGEHGSHGNGQYNHITNTTYEKFVERYVSLAKRRYEEVAHAHTVAVSALAQIRKESMMAEGLQSQLDHEKIVLEEKKAGTANMLVQIGQDTAMSERQVKAARSQQERIKRLKRLLPEYEVSHERAVYKATNLAADTKQIIKGMDTENLEKLRAMQKPIVDVDDLMAAIIVILKSPTSDLTWQKGAKRQLSNLERFVDELLVFDEKEMPESTLVVLEDYLKKPTFDPENLERKTENSACCSLAKWAIGVAKYHRTVISRVKPLQAKVEEIGKSIDAAEHKMVSLEQKRTSLEARLTDLTRGFEDSIIDKNKQEEKTVLMAEMLKTSAHFRKIIKSERKKYQQIYESRQHRIACIPGSVAIAAAFLSYLGPYHYSFRRLMLTVHWPRCLQERGIPLVFDSLDQHKGRVIDWSLDVPRTATFIDASTVDRVNNAEAEPPLDADESDDQSVTDKRRRSLPSKTPSETGGYHGDVGVKKPVVYEKTPQVLEPDDETRTRKASEMEDNVIDGKEHASAKTSTSSKVPDEGASIVAKDNDDVDTIGRHGNQEADDIHGATVSECSLSETNVPVISAQEYNNFSRSLVKFIVGQHTILKWSKSDLGQRQLENAAMIVSSWQRPPLLIDPNGDGVHCLNWLNDSHGDGALTSLDMETSMMPTRVHYDDPIVWRSDPHVVMTIEQGILHGNAVLLENCGSHGDNDVMPLVYHHNFIGENPDPNSEPKMILFCDRRIVCSKKFKIFLATRNPKPQLGAEIASTTQVINYGLSSESLAEELLKRAFARMLPHLYVEKRKALSARERLTTIMSNAVAFVKLQIYKTSSGGVLWSEGDVKELSVALTKKNECLERLKSVEKAVHDINKCRDDLFSIARRGATLFGAVRSLNALRPEYEFSMDYFLHMFDEAVGNAVPPEFFSFTEKGASTNSDKEDSDVNKRKLSSSRISGTGIDGTGTAESRDIANGTGADDGTTSLVHHGRQEPHDVSNDDLVAEQLLFSQAIAEARDKESRHRVIELIRGKRDTNAIDREFIVSDHVIRQLQSEAATECQQHAPDDVSTIDVLPSDGLEYRRLADEEIKDTIDRLTTTIYNQVNLSLYEEDRLLFATLLCVNVNMENDEYWTDNEISLLIQGNPGLAVQLSLADFNCSTAVPSWVPADVWDDIVAVSVLPGALFYLCVHVAEQSDAWRTWYESQCPEEEPVPVYGQNASMKDFSRNDERRDLHQLIIIRMLRPDRFPVAMAKYVSRYLPITTKGTPTLNDVTRAMANHYYGILVLLPPAKEHLLSSLKLTQTPAERIKDFANAHGIPLQTVRMQPHLLEPIERTIHAVVEVDGWLLIEDLHLGSQEFYKELVYHLIRFNKTRALDGDVKPDSKFCLWMTAEPHPCLPTHLINHLHKLSWDHVTETFLTSSPADDDTDAVVQSETLKYKSIHSLLGTVILKNLESISPRILDSLDTELVKYVFGLAVIQATFVCRQALGVRGLTQWTGLGGYNMEDGLTVLQICYSEGQLMLDQLCRTLAKHVYGSLLCHEFDGRQVKQLICDVMTAIHQSENSITLGSVQIPIPSSKDVSGVASWFEEELKKSDISTVDALSLSADVEKDWNCVNASEFIRRLDRLAETNKMDYGNKARPLFSDLSMVALRSSLDLCWEMLPPLLELGDVSKIGSSRTEFTFPYHCPSVLSFSTASNSPMPESLGFVLLQECLWLNKRMCRVRQTIHELRQCLLTGPESIPRNLATDAMALQQEHVPVSWVHFNRQPGVHTLLSWLNQIRRSYDQMYSWVQYGLVPSEGHTQGPRGHIRSLWLGGLVNPQAVFMALRQEKAVISGCQVTEILLTCEVVGEETGRQSPADASVLVHSMYVQGAAWDQERKCLAPARSDTSLMPTLCISAVQIGQQTTVNEERVPYMCPVFMNKSRQMCVLELPLPSCVDPPSLIHSGAALLIDPGILDGAVRHSRTLRHIRSSAQLTVSPTAVDYDIESDHGEETSTVAQSVALSSLTVSKQYSSQQSQLSYKSFTPKASPLPPALQLTRGEQPLQIKASESGRDVTAREPRVVEAVLDSEVKTARYSEQDLTAKQGDQDNDNYRESQEEDIPEILDEKKERQQPLGISEREKITGHSEQDPTAKQGDEDNDNYRESQEEDIPEILEEKKERQQPLGISEREKVTGYSKQVLTAKQGDKDNDNYRESQEEDIPEILEEKKERLQPLGISEREKITGHSEQDLTENQGDEDNDNYRESQEEDITEKQQSIAISERDKRILSLEMKEISHDSQTSKIHTVKEIESKLSTTESVGGESGKTGTSTKPNYRESQEEDITKILEEKIERPQPSGISERDKRIPSLEIKEVSLASQTSKISIVTESESKLSATESVGGGGSDTSVMAIKPITQRTDVEQQEIYAEGSQQDSASNIATLTSERSQEGME